MIACISENVCIMVHGCFNTNSAILFITHDLLHVYSRVA